MYCCWNVYYILHTVIVNGIFLIIEKQLAETITLIKILVNLLIYV